MTYFRKQNGFTVFMLYMQPRNGVKSGDFMKVTVSMDDPKEERHNVTLGRFRDGICNCCTPGQGCAHCCWTTFCISCTFRMKETKFLFFLVF